MYLIVMGLPAIDDCQRQTVRIEAKRVLESLAMSVMWLGGDERKSG
jgi:hypothetical protein